MNSSDSNSDDLTLINGIGPTTQKQLTDLFDVHTVQDLAALSADEIESRLSRLKAEGRRVPAPNKIREWIDQAQKLAADRSSQPIESADSEVEEKVSSPAAGGKWKEFASFIVYFERKLENGMEETRTAVHRLTKVHHMESAKEEEWPGIEVEQLCKWMLGQVREDELRATTEATVAEEPLAAEPPVTVEITGVRAFQPPEADTPLVWDIPRQNFPSIVRSAEPFALEVSFELAGAAMVDMARKGITFVAQFHVRDLSTGKGVQLGDSGPAALIEGKLSYTATLPSVSLQAGIYRMWVVVILQSAPPIPGYVEVPLLRAL